MDVIRDFTGFENLRESTLEHHLNRAYNSVKNHLRYDDESMGDQFKTEIIELAMYYYKNRNNQGITQQTQGSRSVSLSSGIPKEILESLPLPRITVVGGR